PYPGVDTSPTVAEIFYDHDADPDTNNWRTVLSAMTGKYGASPSVFAIDVTDPTTPDLLWEKTQEDIADLGGGMRVSIGMVKNAYGVTVPMVFAATNKVVDTAAIPAEAGGIRMFGFDLATGTTTWSVSEDYVGSQNDLPGAITLVDTDRDGYVDVVLAGDMDGRLWELNALTGANVNGSHIPLFNGGAGATVTGAGVNYPIAASPTVTIGSNGHVLVVFGTGGTDWAPADADHRHSIFVIDMTQKLTSPDAANGAATLLWQLQLDVGEKAWSSPTVADGTVYVSTAYGTMESANPGDDIASTAQLGKIRAVSLAGGETVFSQEVGNQRGSVYIKDGHAYGSTLDGRVVQLGDEDFSSGFVVNVFKLLWKENP
ncbi:MAG: PQQ-binding-like beta-propeller repeat protein, partial [Nitrospinae bacterium]|nr:PQQ-binding-like beta-propeller repeat protein [Nitrospinota bacterium]